MPKRDLDGAVSLHAVGDTKTRDDSLRGCDLRKRIISRLGPDAVLEILLIADRGIPVDP
jgi:hypothetical protein